MCPLTTSFIAARNEYFVTTRRDHFDLQSELAGREQERERTKHARERFIAAEFR